MSALGYILMVGTFIAFVILFMLWIVAENRGSKRTRLTMGLLVMLTSAPVTSLLAVAITQLDDQSYYAAATRHLLDECIAAIEHGEPGFLNRLQEFRKTQVLTYESRSHLLEHARSFRQAGEIQRAKTAPVGQAYDGTEPTNRR